MKKIILSILTVAILAALWYLFLKPYDYVAAFTVNTTVGTINQSIKSWDSSLQNNEITDKAKEDKIVQELKFGDSLHRYTWNIKEVNDTTSRVRLGIKDVNNSLTLRLKTPFNDTDFEERSKKTVLAFHELLTDHLEKFKVSVKGTDTVPSIYCAYVPIKGLQIQKARGMMANYNYLGQAMSKFEVELAGPPFVEITSWDKVTDSISYNFCFPIRRRDDLPQIKDIAYKRVLSTPALHATYNGNYITSDRAWYALENYAETNDYEVSGYPIEIFHNNPNMGGDELNWNADIYLPIKK